MNADTPDPTEDDLHDLAEAAAGKPLVRPAAEGLAAQKSERARIQQTMAELQNQAATNPDLLASNFYRQLKRDLQETEQRIRDYQHELDAGRN